MKNLIIKITAAAFVLLSSVTMYAQSSVSPLENQRTRKNILTYNLTSSFDYAPINISYQRNLTPRIAVTADLGFFNTSERDDIETGVTTFEVAEQNTNIDYSAYCDPTFRVTGPREFAREFNQSGQYISLGARIYPGVTNQHRFYFEPEVTVYNYTADVQTASLNDYAKKGELFVDRIIEVNEVKKTYTTPKLNFGYQFLWDSGLTFDVSTGFGATGLGDNVLLETNQFGRAFVIDNVFIDTEIKFGYAF